MLASCDVIRERPVQRYSEVIRERPVQRYSEVFGLGAEERVSLLYLTFSSRLASMLLRWKAADTVSVVLSFSFQVWRYSPSVAMS